MTAARFESLLAVVASARSRRQTLAALAVLAIGRADPAGSAAADVTAAVCRGRKERCGRKSECCSERCRARKSRKQKCQCSAEGKRCLEVSDCCTDGVRLFCVAGFCVRER